MAAPAYVARSYAGGAPLATISAPMGASDTSFTISPTTGWTSADGHALGTDGPFVIDIDRGLASEEKILCTSINLGSGLVEVYNTGGFLGRGYDQTAATTHTPSGGSSLDGVCQVVWTAVEALEANRVATFILGSAGGTPATGNFLTWGSGQPAWQVGVPNPSGTGGAGVATSVANSTSYTLLDTSVSTVLKGGVTNLGGTVGMSMPVTGSYMVGAAVGWNTLLAGDYGVEVLLAGTRVCVNQFRSAGSPNTWPGVTCGPKIIPITAGQIIQLAGMQTSGGSLQIWGDPNITYLTATLVSTP